MIDLSLEFDPSRLLLPIPGNNPAGESVRYTDVYDKIKAARREDDETLPQGIWKADLKKADWDQVDQLCQEALKTKSKDLQIAIWLMEARFRLEGMGGLAHGLELVLALTRTYWDTLFPQEGGGGYNLRVGLYDWINLKLSDEIHFVAISLPPDKSMSSYRLLDFNEANRVDLPSKKNQGVVASSIAEGRTALLNKISLSINQTPTAYYRYMDKTCIHALKLMGELEEELRLHLGENAPTFYRLKEKVDAVHRFVHQILEARGDNKEKKKTPPLDVSEPRSLKKSFAGPIENREQAYAILGEVANYLERIEPHSPTPYLIHRAISWGNMNLSQVVSNVINEDGSISLLLDILNVRKEQQ
jgi:type VI secretion system ImpA family protein